MHVQSTRPNCVASYSMFYMHDVIEYTKLTIGGVAHTLSSPLPDGLGRPRYLWQPS